MANSNKPEELGLKMGSKDMAMWKNTIAQLKAMIENSEEQLKINEAFLSRAKSELGWAEKEWKKVK